MNDAAPVRLAVLGAGLIGRQHAARVCAEPDATLAGIVDPTDAGRVFAAERGAPWYPDFAAMLRTDRPDGAIIATPSTMHVAHGLQAVDARVPALIEKPVADEAQGAARLVDAAERACVPLLVGHHRRHNPLIQAAKDAIDRGRLGTVIAAHASCWFHKPASYFDVAWRREPGAGPVLVNLIHDLDLLRFFLGEVEEVQAMQSNRQRGFAVEDTAAILLRFASGALGTITVSDTISAPWSWEFTSGENSAYSRTPEACCMIGGTLGSMSVPTLDVWSHEGAPDWWTPIGRTRIEAEPADPLALQIRNLCDVVRGRAAPVVSAREGLATLRVVLAAKQAAQTGRPVRLG